MPYDSLISRTDVQAMIPEQVSQAMLAEIQNVSAAMQLFARIAMPTNQTRFPVISALPTAYFVSGDTGLKQTTEMAWANKYINVEEIAAIVVVPDAVIADAQFDMWGQVRPRLVEAITRLLDAAIFFGTSAPASWPTNVAAAAVAAGNVVARGANTAAEGGIAEDINGLLATLEADGYMPTGFAGNPLFKQYLRGARDTSGQRLLDVGGQVNELYGLPVVYPMPGQWPTGTNAAELFAMQRENFLLGVRQDFTFTLNNTGVVTDDASGITYNLFQQDLTALRVVFRAGWQVSNPINYQQTTEGSRYPAAVLRSPAS